MWANDVEPDKKAMSAGQFGEGAGHAYTLGDIAKVTVDALPREAALARASSPCTDLSLAGARAGLARAQSGTFWQFVRLLRELDGDSPGVAVLENVVGLATSHGSEGPWRPRSGRSTSWASRSMCCRSTHGGSCRRRP